MATRRSLDPAAWAAATIASSLFGLLVPNDRSTRSAAAQRRLRLLAAAAARLYMAGSADYPPLRRAVEAAEGFADGAATADEMRSARDGLAGLSSFPNGRAVQWCCVGCLWWERLGRSHLLGVLSYDDRWPAATASLVLILRDLYLDPSARPVTVPKKWRTPTVIALARGCYDTRDFGGLPVLADALEDAGCDSQPLLTHLRGPGPHVRGCWAVDAVLGL